MSWKFGGLECDLCGLGLNFFGDFGKFYIFAFGYCGGGDVLFGDVCLFGVVMLVLCLLF